MTNDGKESQSMPYRVADESAAKVAKLETQLAELRGRLAAEHKRADDAEDLYRDQVRKTMAFEEKVRHLGEASSEAAQVITGLAGTSVAACSGIFAGIAAYYNQEDRALSYFALFVASVAVTRRLLAGRW